MSEVCYNIFCNLLSAEKEVVGLLPRVSGPYDLRDYSVPGTDGSEMGSGEDKHMIAHEFLSYLHIEFI